jgi:VanZ family protein
MDGDYITFWELIEIESVYGCVVYLISGILLFFMLRKIITKKYKRVLLILLQTCITIILSVFVALLCSQIVFKIYDFIMDITGAVIFYIIYLPALFTELITIPGFYFVLRMIKKHRQDKQDKMKTI